MAPTPLRGGGGGVAIATAIALACCMVVVLAQQPSTEQQMFSSLYRNVEQMVIPSYNSDTGAPTQVILFEMPGLAINRDEYDPNSWAAGGFSARQPDAVAATFVDRLPYYTGPTFVDSGSRISAVWSHFMYQYLIPIVDDPVQVAKVNEARLALANGTLQNNYDTASAAYAAAFTQFTTFRTNCLAKQPGGICSYEGVIYRERLKRKWFSLEVARRDIAAAESKIIALQMQDLKTIFADALYAFASNERVDMGGAGFGASYYLTYFTPSSFWKWWPTTGIYDYNVFADGSILQIALPANSAGVVQQPLYGAFAQQPSGNYTYRPNAGYTGSDRFAYQVTTLIGGSNVTTTITKSIQVIGNDVLAADTAFVTVSCEASYSSSSSSSTSTSLSTSSSFRLGIGWFGASGSLKTSSSSSSSTSESLDSKTKISFDLARVSITRLWIDTSLLSFYPVAIRNLGAQSWSDGTITPATGALQFKFKLLPTAFLVARNIQISTSLGTTMSSLVQSASSYDGSVRVRVGPFFSGSTSVSQSSSSRDYRESSSYTGGVMSVRGPQVIGWVCTPVPPFPTADEAAVRKWEADQIARQNVANNSTASSTPSSTSASTSGAKNTTASVQTTG